MTVDTGKKSFLLTGVLISSSDSMRLTASTSKEVYTSPFLFLGKARMVNNVIRAGPYGLGYACSLHGTVVLAAWGLTLPDMGNRWHPRAGFHSASPRTLCGVSCRYFCGTKLEKRPHADPKIGMVAMTKGLRVSGEASHPPADSAR